MNIEFAKPTLIFQSLLFSLGLFIPTTTIAAQTADRPNVLFIIADDLNRRISPYGDNEALTPNLNRLARRSIRFTRAYSQYPVCSPSRVSFLSGRRPEHTGLYGNDESSRTPLLQDAVFLPEHFRKQGWFTARLGKVFHIGRDVPECWDISEEGTPGERIIYQPNEPTQLDLKDRIEEVFRLKGGGGERADTYRLGGDDESGLIDVRNGKRAAELIRERADADKPFFLTCGFRRPHLPYLLTAEWFDKFPLASLPLPDSDVPAIPSIEDPPAEADTRRAMQGYFAAVAFMDAQLGRVLDVMDEKSLWDNTLVVLIGDHGYMLGDRGGWWGKNQLYDISAGTAMFVAAPGAPRNVECHRVVEFLDLYPTLADWCGLPLSPRLEGRSLVPLLRNPEMKWPHPAYTMVARSGSPAGLAVTTESHRYLQHADGRTELFNVAVDPRETRDLSDDPGSKRMLTRMIGLAEDYKKRFR